MTSITISEPTRRRLAGYKSGDSTFDDVLNRLMDAVPIEDVLAEDIKLHYERLNDSKTKWVGETEFFTWLEKKAGSRHPAGPKPGRRRSKAPA